MELLTETSSLGSNALVELNRKMISDGNLPKSVVNSREVYTSKYGTGVVVDGMLYTGQCQIGDITFYKYIGGFLAEFKNPRTQETRYMRLGEDSFFFFPSKDILPLTVNQVLCTLHRTKENSFYFNTFKLYICNIINESFRLTKTQKKLMSDIKNQIL